MVTSYIYCSPSYYSNLLSICICLYYTVRTVLCDRANTWEGLGLLDTVLYMVYTWTCVVMWCDAMLMFLWWCVRFFLGGDL